MVKCRYYYINLTDQKDKTESGIKKQSRYKNFDFFYLFQLMNLYFNSTSFKVPK